MSDVVRISITAGLLATWIEEQITWAREKIVISIILGTVTVIYLKQDIFNEINIRLRVR